MSLQPSYQFAGQTPEDEVPTRRFIVSVQQLMELSPFYLDAIEVYRRDGDHLVFLDRQVIEMITSLGGHPSSLGSTASRQAWDNLEIVIPDVEKSNPFDSITEIHKAYHLAVVVAGDTRRLTENLPPHLQVVDSYMDPKLQRTSPLHKMPDYFMESVQVLSDTFRKEYSNFSNTVTVLTYMTTTARISIDSELDLSKGTICYAVELTPGSQKTIVPTSEGAVRPRAKILVWNCRGAVNESFMKNMVGLLAKHKPCVAIVTDTRIGNREADHIIENLPFTGAYKAESVGRSGGVWFMYQEWKIKVHKVRQSEGGGVCLAARSR